MVFLCSTYEQPDTTADALPPTVYADKAYLVDGNEMVLDRAFFLCNRNSNFRGK
jgi:hypothetical protein